MPFGLRGCNGLARMVADIARSCHAVTDGERRAAPVMPGQVPVLKGTRKHSRFRGQLLTNS